MYYNLVYEKENNWNIWDSNIINKKIYIGQSRDIERRLREHKTALISNRHQNIHLQRAINKHGIENFSFHILEEINLEEYNEIFITVREQFWIDFWRPENTYNIIKTPNALGEARIGEKNYFYGKEHCIELKQKFSNSKRKTSEEDLLIIFDLRKQGFSYNKIAKKIGNIDRKTIESILKGKLFYSKDIHKENYDKIKNIKVDQTKENHPRAKTSKEDQNTVNKIFELYFEGFSHEKIGKIIGYSASQIGFILSGKSRMHNKEDFSKNREKLKNRKKDKHGLIKNSLKDIEQIRQILNLRISGLSCQEISIITNKSNFQIRRIINGKSKAISEKEYETYREKLLNVKSYLRGKENPNSRSSPEDIEEVKQIFKLRNDGLTLKQIGNKFGYSFQYISDILLKKIRNFE